jgi:glyoxylase-like metal-dependent hydrolase (beta-lactamase superfamily II)
MQEIIRIDLGGVNSYLICNKGQYILVDTGGHMFMDKEYNGRREKLDEELNHLGVTEDNLQLIILTHGDNDHSSNAAYFRKKYNAPIAMHKEDVFLVDSPKDDCYLVNCKYRSIIFKLVFKVMDKKIRALEKKVYKEFESFAPDVIIKEGDTLEPYGFDGVIYHTPGHTPGSICILDSYGNLICGDIWANQKKPELAPNAADFNQLKDSANRMKSLDYRTIYPGHGLPF